MTDAPVDALVEMLKREYKDEVSLRVQAARLLKVNASVSQWTNADTFWRYIDELRREIIDCFKYGFHNATITMCGVLVELLLVNELGKVLQSSGSLQRKAKSGNVIEIPTLDDLRKEKLDELITMALAKGVIPAELKFDVKAVQYLRNKYAHGKKDTIKWSRENGSINVTVSIGGKDSQVPVPYDDEQQKRWLDALVYDELIPLYVVKVIWKVIDYYHSIQKS